MIQRSVESGATGHAVDAINSEWPILTDGFNAGTPTGCGTWGGSHFRATRKRWRRDPWLSQQPYGAYRCVEANEAFNPYHVYNVEALSYSSCNCLVVDEWY